MKKGILLSAILFAATASIVYSIFQKKSSKRSSAGTPRNPRSHHRTVVFSKAKQTIASVSHGE